MSFRRARSAPGAQDRSNEDAAKGKAITMDMTKFAGSKFITVDDLRDGPREGEVITSVEPGKYDRPVVTLESGDKFSANKTSVSVLISAYGANSNDWLGCVIALSIGKVKDNGEDRECVVVRPISPPKPLAARTPVPKRPSKKPDFDDDIPF